MFVKIFGGYDISSLLYIIECFDIQGNKYLDDPHEIRQMMRKSTLFLSLSDFSGVLARVYALIGAAVVYKLLQHHYLYYPYVNIESKTFKAIIIVVLLVLATSTLTVYLFSVHRARRNGEKLIAPTTKRVFYNSALSLLAGGALCVLLINNGHYGLLTPVMLILYRLACVNVNKYTFDDAHYLDITEIILRLLAAQFSGYGLLFWVLGFGVCHILYGGAIHFRCERK